MHRSSTSQAMGSGAGGIFSSNGGGGYQCSTHTSSGSSTGSSASGSSSLTSNARCDCIRCTYCQQFLGNISIKCGECVNFHLCLKCFSMSAEIGEHKKDHNYFLKSSTSFPLFDSENLWTYKEELHLLQFIEQYGFDNWEEIGKHLPNRSADECMQHYHSYYIYGNLGKSTFTTNLNLKSKLDYSLGNGSLKQEPQEFKIEDPTLDNKSEMSTTVLLPPIEMSLEEQRALGYMPLRDDFEREYKNDGEQLLSNLNIANNQLALLNENINIEKMANVGSSQGPGTPSKQESNQTSLDSDDVVDFELKLTLMEMYRECLQERQRFKKIAREYGLVNNASALLNKQKVLFAQQAGTGALLAPNGLSYNHVSNKKRLKKTIIPMSDYKEMTEMNENLKKYAQFMSVSDYETLLDNLRKQKQICKKIQELKHYRSHYGLQKMSEIEELKKGTCAGSKGLTPVNGTRKRKRKSYHLYAESPNKRLTRRQNITNNSMLMDTSKVDTTLNETNLTDLNISNIRNFSPNSSRSSSRSTSRSRSNTPSNTSSNSMNIYELVEPAKEENGEDLISEDQDQAEDEIESENDENLANEQIYTDEDENETSEDLSSGGAASSGGSGINEPNVGSLANNKNQSSRRLRALNNRRNNSLLVKNKKKKSMKLNLSLSTPNKNKANGNNKSKLLNGSLNKSNLKRTNLLLKSAKSPNGIGNGNKIISKKLKLLELQRNGHQRSERLCSMPGYNLLSENEKKLISSIDLKPSDYITFKTNLIKNNLARRKQKTVNQAITNFFQPTSSATPTSPGLNETCPNPSSTPCKMGKSMMLRRHSANGTELTENGLLSHHAEANGLSDGIANGNGNLSTSTAMPNGGDSSLNDTMNGSLNTSNGNAKKKINHKLMSILMKTTCPKYFQIPNSSRKRILRFLCDNGWIDVS